MNETATEDGKSKRFSSSLHTQPSSHQVQCHHTWKPFCGNTRLSQDEPQILLCWHWHLTLIRAHTSFRFTPPIQIQVSSAKMASSNETINDVRSSRNIAFNLCSQHTDDYSLHIKHVTVITNSLLLFLILKWKCNNKEGGAVQ